MTLQTYIQTISKYVKRACKDFNLQSEVLFSCMSKMQTKVPLATYITTIVTAKIPTSSINEMNNGSISYRCDLLCRVITIILSKMFESPVQNMSKLNEIGDFIFMNTGRTLWADEFDAFIGEQTPQHGIESYEQLAMREYNKIKDRLPHDVSFVDFERAFHEPLTQIYQNILSRKKRR